MTHIVGEHGHAIGDLRARGRANRVRSAIGAAATTMFGYVWIGRLIELSEGGSCTVVEILIATSVQILLFAHLICVVEEHNAIRDEWRRLHGHPPRA